MILEISGTYQLFSGGLLISQNNNKDITGIQASDLQTYALLNTEFETDSKILGFSLIATNNGVINVTVKFI